ncbi:MAG TPA: hypothetical protein VOA87_17340 [Thermoanaerobaculia bacterium]|nr:hypothetical protein [Thermoanaerobaculia bacterium]
MKSKISVILVALFLALPLATMTAEGKTMGQERAGHPRIARAIHQLEDAIAYMEHAPHDFGGHKAEAIAASRAAVVQLKLALAYRAGADTPH